MPDQSWYLTGSQRVIYWDELQSNVMMRQSF